ncbi:MAG: DUF11 domain-containing protein [Gemmatimonadota bacterium]|nr:MAG: DUF11 domain-containing protein [Gemmatimonadota bacterium]
MMNWMLRSCARALSMAGLLTAVVAVTAQAQTPENTVITNTAEVTWTDANGNAYAPVSGSVSVTVGFQAAIDATPDGATVNPASPSTNDTLTFYVRNAGNGVDTVSVTEDLGANPGVISVTGYVLDGTPQATLAALNTALSTTQIAAGDSVEIQVVFDVPAAQGGVSTTYTLTGTSFRDNLESNDGTITVSPPAVYAATVTPDGLQNLQLLPSNGTNETFTFQVTNSGNIADDFDLTASNPGTAITIVSVDGTAGTTAQITNLGSGVSVNVVVEYQINDVPGGTVDTLFLSASPVSDPTNDDGFADLTVIRPVLTITKAAYRDDQTTLIGAGDTVLPNEFIQYLVTVTNTGSTDAETVHVDDPQPAQVTAQSASANVGVWTFTVAPDDVDADLTGTLGPGASVSFWIRVQIN